MNIYARNCPGPEREVEAMDSTDHFVFVFVLFIFYFICLLLFKYSCLNFPPTIPPALPIPTSYPRSYPALTLSMSPLSMFLDDPSPFSPLSLLTSPLVTVSLFFISMSLVISCLFCWLGFTYRWDHMVLVFHRLAYFT